MRSSGICLDVDGSAIESGVDRSRYHHTLTPTDTYTTRGKFGKGTLFNGTTSFVDCGNDSSLNITDAITIEAWVKSSDTTNIQMIVEKVNATPSGFALYFRPTSPYMRFLIKDSSGNTHIAEPTVQCQDGHWHHIIATFNGTVMKVYVNSIEKASTDWTGSIPTNIKKLLIGYGSHYFFHYNGTIDEVRIYNRALSATEIKRNYLSKAYLYVPHPVRIP